MWKVNLILQMMISNVKLEKYFSLDAFKFFIEKTYYAKI